MAKTDSGLDAVEKGLAEMLPQAKNFAPPAEGGIHEDIDNAIDLIATALDGLKMIKRRLDEFDSLQRRFYKGGHGGR